MTQVMWKRIAHHFAVMLAMSGTNEHDDIQFFQHIDALNKFKPRSAP